MLKFIRKYQLFILAIGGSLLMVVFLFQPIIGKLSPDPRKAAVAKLADGSSFSGFDFQRASFDLAVIKRVAPLLLFPFDQGGLGIEAGTGESSELHWLLLAKQAKDAGLIGDAGEGRTWIPLLAQRTAAYQLQQQAQQGQVFFNNQFEFQQAVNELSIQYETALTRNAALSATMMQNGTEDEVYRSLATARGIERLYRVFTSMPAYSDLGAMQAAKSRFDSVAVDAVLIKGETLASAVPAPSDAELQAFFDQYKADAPTDNDYRIGYTQPARVKLGWITLNKQSIESAIVVDRVELNKLWRTDHNLPESSRKYPGDFAGERLNIENEYRTERALDIMIEADKIIRSKVLQATRGLAKNGTTYTLPDDWDTKRPTLESIAQSVVDGLKEQFSVTIPLPTVNIHTDRWLDSRAISTLPGIGTAAYRIGQRPLQAFLIPQVVESQDAAALLAIQPGIPAVDPAAEDAQGNRYYALVYEINHAGPADSIDDAGRDKVLKDYRTVKAYELLTHNIDAMTAAATAASNLGAAIDTAMALASSDAPRPGIARNLLVGTEGVARGRLASTVEPGINTPEFRDAVHAAAEPLNELATPESLAQSPIFVPASIPNAKAVALAKIIAPRPLTIEQFHAQMGAIISNEGSTQIRQALAQTDASPFSLASLSERYGYTRVKKRNGESDEDLPVDSTDSES